MGFLGFTCVRRGRWPNGPKKYADTSSGRLIWLKAAMPLCSMRRSIDDPALDHDAEASVDAVIAALKGESSSRKCGRRSVTGKSWAQSLRGTSFRLSLPVARFLIDLLQGPYSLPCLAGHASGAERLVDAKGAPRSPASKPLSPGQAAGGGLAHRNGVRRGHRRHRLRRGQHPPGHAPRVQSASPVACWKRPETLNAGGLPGVEHLALHFSKGELLP